MRFVQYVGGGRLELNYMWLPTWMGMDSALKQEVEKALAEKFQGRGVDELDALNEELLDWFEQRFSAVPGLRDYLDGLKFVTDG
jgi:hypothetical protein